METLDYRLAWIFYALAGVAISVVIWRVLKKYLWREMAYLIETFLVAIIFTPWYVIADQDVLAPAIIIFVMDTITIDAVAGIRGLIPLILAFGFALIITAVLSIVYRVKRKKRQKRAKAARAQKKAALAKKAAQEKKTAQEKEAVKENAASKTVTTEKP